MIHLDYIKLRNWRSYRYAKFEFPPANEYRNVILITGASECGKTSFFEALVLGLYGRRGLRLAPRARKFRGNDEARTVHYSKFMESILHKQVFKQEEQNLNCEVEIAFQLNSEPVVIHRIWHFDKERNHLPEDDDLRVLRTQEPVAQPAIDVEDPDKWYSDYIARKFLPVDLANFFLFDGEQAQHYANLDMADQVKKGIKGLLGLTTLESLAEDLQTYARRERSHVSHPDEESLSKLASEIEELQHRIRTTGEQIDQLDNQITDLNQDSDDLARRMAEDDKTSMADIVDLTKEEENHRAIARDATQKISDLLASEMALMLVGEDLVNKTVIKLSAEAKREEWEAGRTQGDEKFNEYRTDLSNRLLGLEPPISKELQKKILQVVKTAWQDVWKPIPEGAADSYLHKSLTGRIRDAAINKLQEVDHEITHGLESLVGNRKAALKTAEEKRKQRLEAQQRKPDVAKNEREAYNKIREQIRSLQSEKQEIIRLRETLKSEINSKNAVLQRLTSDINSDTICRAKYAEKISTLIRRVVAKTIPQQTKNVGDAMTTAWKNMSHMSERVERINVTNECEVQMLNRDGKDIRQVVRSAGGEQIFTQALFWSVTHVSQHEFPFVVDTPLARLSLENRLGVIRQFTDHPGQVILLSTDTEVVGKVREAIQDKIAINWKLDLHEYENGIGHTTVTEL